MLSRLILSSRNLRTRSSTQRIHYRHMSTPPQPSTPLRYLLILDFEATCIPDRRIYNQEIIELPTLVYDLSQSSVIATFHAYIKPLYNPALSAFCTELTGIEQETVDAAKTFKAVWKEYRAFLATQCQDTAPESYTFLTCGDWDLKTMLPAQLELSKLNYPDPSAALPDMRNWINIKKHFARQYKRQRAVGMAGMLKTLGMELEGRHHSGIDDCRNIARIVTRMCQDGWRPER